MKRTNLIKRITSFALCAVMLFSAVSCATQRSTPDPVEQIAGENHFVEELVDIDRDTSAEPTGDYNEGVVLVKYSEEITENIIEQLDFKSAEPLYPGSEWYYVELRDSTKTVETVSYLRELGCFDAVDYDYIMEHAAEVSSLGVTDNPNYDQQTNLGLHNIPHGWTQNGKHPGGSSDVVVAVIDTGVDYNHLDLRNNIWVNSAEIPDNGRDDDGNGYVDDVYGWDCVGGDKDPMDDNGHGTHVAGIIAAENNKIGGVGVAYNCKIMVLKAGNSSGYFNNSDIAEAIQYAYMNGASVINMSFGGSSISLAVEDALENAYTSCVLVAAAGNDSMCNHFGCRECDFVGVSYPAALPYVIGVMSVDPSGSSISRFSNYDHCPHDSVEYEVYAVGEAVSSCWPNNKYATLNGTSMAAPTVSGIAALLRSAFPDREVYSTKYLQSQIVNTGTVNPYNTIIKKTDDAHSVADVYEALTKLPKPDVNLYDYYIDDSTSISEKNNGNGVVDAGETVYLFISLMNRGGVASNVNVSIDTYRSEVGNETLTDPYFTLVNPTMHLSDIGTYSVRESAPDKYFEIIVSPECPNDYLTDFNIRYTYKNGMDDKDTTVYSGDGIAQFNVSRGYCLPSVISEDTVYTADRLYIVSQNVLIAEGVNVVFEAGCEIQYYQDDAGYYSTVYNSPKILNYGTLTFAGSETQRITIAPADSFSTFVCIIESAGYTTFEYTDAINLESFGQDCSNVVAYYSSFRYCNNVYGQDDCWLEEYSNGVVKNHQTNLYFGEITNTVVDVSTKCVYSVVKTADKCVFINEFIDNYTSNLIVDSMSNSIFYSKDSSAQWSNDAGAIRITGFAKNNAFMQESNSNQAQDYVTIYFYSDGNYSANKFSGMYYSYANMLLNGYLGADGRALFDLDAPLTDESCLWPHVVSIELFDKNGNPVNRVGTEEIKVRVTFNRPMDRTQDTFLTFGTIEPYADYRIEGEYISDTVWEGTYTLKAQIENGQNFLKVNNACAAEDITKTVFGEYHLHEFTIDTTAAMSMNLQAVPTAQGINLTWFQDDYDTLLGYNIYRSDAKDGYYTKLNSTVLLPTDESFLDENAEPGKSYWYTYTVVLSDFSESRPAGKIMATAADTILPNVYHTPVNQGYLNNNLGISCTASDNIAISRVVLHYRAKGAAEWKSLTMTKQNDKYSATIFGSELTLDGVEYYIVAYDSFNSITKGSPEAPYFIVIKDSSLISRIGDVDGDGVVTTKDALMMMQHIEGTVLLTDDQFKRADLNGSGVLDSVEVLRILQYINGKVNTLEM